MRVVFPFLAQLHQIPHSLPIALELAQRHPDVEVHVAYTSPEHLEFIRALVALCAANVNLNYHRLQYHWFDRLRDAAGQRHSKFLTLFNNRSFFDNFDAIVTPEQTSLLLRRFGLSRPRMIWTRHGAGDREVGFGKRTRHFDFVLMAGPKIERRLLSLHLLKPGCYATGVYAKFDWVRRRSQDSPRLFDNDRPTVLYNPHFRGSLSSWPLVGRQVLESFADGSRYNLIFAPHVRLFNGNTSGVRASLASYQDLPHIHIDPGSERSIDMTYTATADIYLGDVSSQLAEFLIKPRPCLFLNPHQHAWHGNPSFESWNLGPVSTSVSNLEGQIDDAVASHDLYSVLQRRYFADSFDVDAGEPSAIKGCDAIAAFLRDRLRT